MNKDDFVIFAEPGDFPVDKVKRKNALLKKFHCECETIEERQAVLKELFGAVGRNPRVTPLFYCDLGFNIFIGDDFYSNYNLTILDCAKVTIGNNCYIADNVGIYAVGHPTDRLLRRVDIEYGAPVVIGDDVWIGGHTVIAAGNPCRVIRKVDERDRKYIFKDIEYPPELIEKHYGKNK